MLVECEVWVSDKGEDVKYKGCTWGKMHVERTIIDTDLYEWFGMIKPCDSPLYPYEGQCHVPHRTNSGRDIFVDKGVLEKIRHILAKGNVMKIESSVKNGKSKMER